MLPAAALPLLSSALLFAAALLLVPTLPLTIELLLLAPAALLATSRRPAPAAPGSIPLKLAVIIPAHNEDKLIALCVQSILTSAAAVAAVDLRPLVIAHNCRDTTAAQAHAAGARALILDEPVGGKGLALDHGFTAALADGADAVLVIDADSIVSPGLIASVATRFSLGADALQARYEVANPTANQRTRLATLAFRGMNVLRPLGRAQLGLSAGIFGNGFGLSAATIRRVPYAANSVVEDLEYHLNLIRAGIRVEFLNDASVLGEMPVASAAASTQRARWEGGRLLMRRRWTVPLLSQVLRGRLRLLEPLLDLLALPLAKQAVLLLAALALTLWPLLAGVPSAAPILLLDCTGLAGIALYLLTAALLGPEPLATLAALASAPGYILWKLLLIPRTRLAARSNAAWIRTARNAEAPAKPPL